MPKGVCENPDCEQGGEEGAETLELLRALLLQHHIRSGSQAALGHGKKGSIFHDCKRFAIYLENDDRPIDHYVYGHGVESNGPFSTTGHRNSLSTN